MTHKLKDVLHYYLPYKLKIKYWEREIVMNLGEGSSVNWIGLKAVTRRERENCKPILRPLSKLTKELSKWAFNHNGEWFDSIIPAESWINLMVDNIDDMPFVLFEKILSLHGDIFGLIESGQAIEKTI